VLPLVSLEYTYNLNGAGGTAGDSYDLMAERDYEDHVLGLRMQVPIGNQAARSRLRRSLAQRMQLLASRAQREQIIRQEVLNSVDQLQANWQRIQAALERVRLAERLLEIESRQLLVGQGFDFRVLEAQVALAEAQSALIQAVADYQIAQVDIAFATGTLLGQSAIDWRPIAGPPK
jgi:outer membrane protein TolC